MEFVGINVSEQIEVKIRMPKFGNIRNVCPRDVMENYEKKENVIRTKLRNDTPIKGIERPVRRIRQGIFELLRLHPYPRCCGPYACFINGNKTFKFFVTFTHSAAQVCGRWSIDQTETLDRNDPRFKLSSCKLELSGPASTWSKKILYPCQQNKCSIQCPCNLCSTDDQPCNRYCAESPCDNCDQQCQEHKCDLDRKYTNKDSFTIPFYYNNLDENARSEDTNRLLVYDCETNGPYEPEKNFIKHSGIPRSCTQCQIDLLDHEVHHHVLHFRCKFCRKYLRLLRNRTLDKNNAWKQEKEIKFDDDTTCSYCYKLFCDSSKRKYHEKTEHILSEKPFKCDQCSKSYASRIGLTHHQRQHMEDPTMYSCEKCKKSFTSEISLKRHVDSIHNPNNKAKTICEKCGKPFSRADLLKRHLLEVHKESSVSTHYTCQLVRPFKCDYCGESFKRKEKLETHARVHKEMVENYKCDYCEKTFGRKDNLSKHVKKYHMN